jgi:FAD/FMN-containing dehydrogenase
MQKISSWGRLSADLHRVIPLSNREHLSEVIGQHLPGIAHGMGRSYGDICLNSKGTLWRTSCLDRFIHFDETTGRLRCEAGVLLKTIQATFVKRGWMLPLTPGTQMVTVGGAIANDVHGKNHHIQGSFGNHVQRIKLLRTDGRLIECGPEQLPEWFKATVGGMGLTGVITEVDILLKRVPGPWLVTETIPYSDLDTFFKLADDSEADWEHTVSWIDCLSKGAHRGLFMRANPIETDKAPERKSRVMTFPFTPPVSLVNRLSLRPFNQLYFHLNQRRNTQQIAHYESFFYPLDNILEWNKMYGRKGFFQYQCVIPREIGYKALQALLTEISRCQEGSFLAVLKTFGERASPGLMSFVTPGVTLALDFANKGARTIALFKRLDDIVYNAGGRLYCAKNAYMSRELFEAGYPNLQEFLTFCDPGISSGLSRRLMGQ